MPPLDLEDEVETEVNEDVDPDDEDDDDVEDLGDFDEDPEDPEDDEEEKPKKKKEKKKKEKKAKVKKEKVKKEKKERKKSTKEYTPNSPLLSQAVTDYCEALNEAMTAEGIENKDLAEKLDISTSRVSQITDAESRNKYGLSHSLKGMVAALDAVGYKLVISAQKQ